MKTGPTLMQMKNGLISLWKIVKMYKYKIQSHEKYVSFTFYIISS